MKHIFILLLLSLCQCVVFAQQTFPSEKVKDLIFEGQQHLLKHEYLKALKAYNKALKSAPDFIAAKRGKGASLQLLGHYADAAVLYDEILSIDPDYSRTMYYDLGEMYFKSGNYTKAYENFKEFNKILGLSEEEFEYKTPQEKKIEAQHATKVINNIRSCELAMDSVRYQNISLVQNLGNKINTMADEYFPFLTNDQNYLFFTSRNDAFSDENIFLSEKENGEFGRGETVSSTINSAGNEGMSTVVKNGRKIYFTACDRRQVLGTCDLWEAELKDLKLSEGEPVKGYINSGKWESQASVSCDGTIIYFASNREGGVGGTDIWLSRLLPDGRWGQPENLGAAINTEKDEEAPFITNDGQVLYFSSNGHIGLGEQDIFMSRRNKDAQWSKAINLGSPVNSSYRELGFFLTADGKTGYFSSDRETGFGGMDIYKFELPERLTSYPMTYVAGRVMDSLYNLPVPTTIYFNDRLPMKTDEQGHFFRCVPAGEVWDFSIAHTGFKTYRQRRTIPKHDNKNFYEVVIKLAPEDYLLNLTEKERKEELNSIELKESIFFGVDKHKINVESEQKIDAFLTQCLDGKSRIKQLDIVGFADASGGDAYNMMLSEKRAKSVAVYLQSRGVRVDRVYLGAEGTINNADPAWKNRRVELKIKLLRKEG